MSDPARFFPDLPDSARLWAFGVSRPLLPEEEERLLATVDGFLGQWAAHGHPLAAARNWHLGRFLLVAVDDAVTPPSGCSIDSLVRALQSLEQDLGVEMVGGAPIFYREPTDARPSRISRSDFKARAERGGLTRDTIVFDLSLTRVSELRAGGFERRAADGWHERLFP